MRGEAEAAPEGDGGEVKIAAMPPVPGVDWQRFLDAVAVVESQAGRNNCPRFEVSYLPAGEAYTVQGRRLVGTGRNVNAVVLDRWRLYGLASAASFGPWQILYHSAADRGFTEAPWELWSSATSLPWVLLHFAWLVDRRHPRDLRELAACWNTGQADPARAPEYVEKVERAYL